MMKKIFLLIVLACISFPAYAVRSLGTASIVSGAGCPSTSVRTSACYTATVTNIPDRDGNLGNIASLTATLKVSEPDSGGTPIGTVVVLSGGGSSGYYEQLSNGATNLVLPMLAANWRVVQVAWANNSGQGCMGGTAGHLALAGRSATLFKAIHDSSTFYVAGTPFALAGQSGGSTQIAYALAQYGAGDYVDTAIMTSGPPHSRIDYGTMGALKPYWNTLGQTLMNVTVASGGQLGYAGGDAAFMDGAYSPTQTAIQTHAFDGGPNNLAFRDSIMNGTAEYRTPNTDLTFVYGDRDSSGAMPLGKLYANTVTGKSKTISNTTGLVQHIDVPGSTSGSALILAALAAATFNH